MRKLLERQKLGMVTHVEKRVSRGKPHPHPKMRGPASPNFGFSYMCADDIEKQQPNVAR